MLSTTQTDPRKDRPLQILELPQEPEPLVQFRTEPAPEPERLRKADPVAPLPVPEPDAGFPVESPYLPSPTWRDVVAVCRYLAQWAAILTVVGAAFTIGYYLVFEVIPALLSGLVSLIQTAFAALAAGVSAALVVLGKIAACLAGAFLLFWLGSGLLSRGTPDEQPAPGQPLRPANNTKNAVNTSTKTTVITIVNNLEVKQ